MMTREPKRRWSRTHQRQNYPRKSSRSARRDLKAWWFRLAGGSLPAIIIGITFNFEIHVAPNAMIWAYMSSSSGPHRAPAAPQSTQEQQLPPRRRRTCPDLCQTWTRPSGSASAYYEFLSLLFNLCYHNFCLKVQQNSGGVMSTLAGSSSCQRRSLGRVWGLWEVGKISPRWPPACASRRWGWRQWGFWKWCYWTWSLCGCWRWWCWQRRFFEEDLTWKFLFRWRSAWGRPLERIWAGAGIKSMIVIIIFSIIIPIIINRQGSLRRGTNGTTSIPITLSVSLQELRAKQWITSVILRNLCT